MEGAYETLLGSEYQKPDSIKSLVPSTVKNEELTGDVTTTKKFEDCSPLSFHEFNKALRESKYNKFNQEKIEQKIREGKLKFGLIDEKEG